MKHYVDICHLKAKYEKTFGIGEHVIIQTKIDGANSSFTYDPKEEKVVAFSRKRELNKENTLHGFYEWAMKWPAEIIKEISENGRYIFFGEFLVKHTVSYPDSMYREFYMFDVWDCGIEQYLPYEQALQFFHKLVKAAAEFCNEDEAITIHFVPVLYDGPFQGWEKVIEFLSLSTTGARPCEEGIVIKSQDRLDNQRSDTPPYVKIVNSQFSEVHGNKPKKGCNAEEIASRAREKEKIALIATERRLVKLLEKAIDNGELRPDWDEKDMKWIAQNIIPQMIEDCLKEEKEIVEQCPHFKKICGAITMEYVKKIAFGI